MKKLFETCCINWGEVNPVHAYYNGSCTSKDTEYPSWSTSFKTMRTRKTSSALEALWKTLFVLSFVSDRNIERDHYTLELAMGDEIGFDIKNVNVEKPTVSYGYAGLANKGEDYFLINPDCERIVGNSSTSFSFFADVTVRSGFKRFLVHWLQGETFGTTVTFVGDSRCILDTRTGVVSLLTADHGLEENVEEREHVTSSGGEVGPLCCWPGGLCLSVSIGDTDVGKFIVPIPHVKQVKFSNSGGALIIASDCMNPSLVLNVVAAVGNKDVILDGEVGFDTASASFTKYTAGISFNKPDLSAYFMFWWWLTSKFAIRQSGGLLLVDVVGCETQSHRRLRPTIRSAMVAEKEWTYGGGG
ncbi:probable protein phosphatase 2C 5 [Tanacetum coccineum]